MLKQLFSKYLENSYFLSSQGFLDKFIIKHNIFQEIISWKIYFSKIKHVYLVSWN